MTATGLAGCSGDNSSCDDDGTGDGGGGPQTDPDGDQDGTTTETTETTTESPELTPNTEAPVTTTQGSGGSETTTTTSGRDLGDPKGGVTESSVDGLRIVGLQSKVAEEFPYPRQGECGLKIDVENTGDQELELTDYTWHSN